MKVTMKTNSRKAASDVQRLFIARVKPEVAKAVNSFTRTLALLKTDMRSPDVADLMLDLAKVLTPMKRLDNLCRRLSTSSTEFADQELMWDFFDTLSSVRDRLNKTEGIRYGISTNAVGVGQHVNQLLNALTAASYWAVRIRKAQRASQWLPKNASNFPAIAALGRRVIASVDDEIARHVRDSRESDGGQLQRQSLDYLASAEEWLDMMVSPTSLAASDPQYAIDRVVQSMTSLITLLQDVPLPRAVALLRGAVSRIQTMKR